MRKKLFQRLAWVARYGHVSPNEAAHWETNDLHDFMRELNEIVRDENKPRRGH